MVLSCPREFHDTGYMFAYGRHLRFLMKEVGNTEPSGDSVTLS
jgi:hypothetical protein